MNTQSGKKNKRQAGYSLLTVTFITGVSITLYASMARLTSSSTSVNHRNNLYNSSVAAAEADTEEVLSYIARDFYNQAYDPANLDTYRNLIPTTPWAGGYQFSDGAGNVDMTWVNSTPTLVRTNLNSQFTGLYGFAYSCTIRSRVHPLGTPYNNLAAAVQQDFQLACIPVFQYAIFYTLDLEINPGPIMQITGKVHSNADIYTAPQTGLEYMDDVTAVGRIMNNRKQGDPQMGLAKVAPVFDAQHLEHVSSLSLPIGTNNTPMAVHEILNPPPFGENPLSQMGRERYFNKVDLLVTVTDTNVAVNTGRWNALAYVPPDVPATTNSPANYSFILTNRTFYDQREAKNTMLTEIDVLAFSKWMTNSAPGGGAVLDTFAQFQNSHHLNSIYVQDKRVKTGKLTAVRVFNGKQLPPSGLTVASPLPMYVQGHFNAPNTVVGSTDTTQTMPSSLVGDAITVLSQNWSDARSTQSMSSRAGVDTTVNSAFLGGIVETTTAGGGHYSGGVENFPRFLEDWSSKTLTYNGSMVVMYPSVYATSYWINPGTYYNPPVRKWAFDRNFLTYNKLPPATPEVRKVIRGQWNVVAAY